MNRLSSLTRKFAAPILTGILIGTSYIPFPPWAMFFCFVPLWKFWIEAESAKDVLLSGWISQFVLTFIGFNWVAHTIHEYGHLPWPIAGLGMLFFCSFASLNVPAAGWIWYKLFRHSSKNVQIAALVTLTAITERLYPMIFDWHFGYTWLWIGWPAYQLADVIGFAGLSTITIAFNGLFVWGYLLWRDRRPVLRPVAIALGALVLLTAVGMLRKAQLATPDGKARVLVVQANISNNDKEYAEHGAATKRFIVEKFFDLTSRALAESSSPPDFALWPETAFPEILTDAYSSAIFVAQLRAYLQMKRLALVTGSYSVSNRRLSNAMTVLNSSGQIVGSYSKTHLLAFGEYLPGSTWFPRMKEWVPEIADFGRGEGPKRLDLGTMKLGGQICYEGLFDGFSRGLAKLGAQMIVNSTNDSWYPDWNEPYQHLYMTLARAVETRRPLVRATNTGISTAVLADGSIQELSPRGQEWFHFFDVPYLQNPPEPPFLSWGFYFIPAILGLTLVALVARRKQ